MSADAWVVVKVGGSLFDWPDLGARLHAWLTQLDAARVMLVPGGGAMADAIRRLDCTHQLGAEASHWLAIEAMSVTGRFVRALLADFAYASESVLVLDALPFFQADEANAEHLPHSWQVTSDSLAVRAAVLAKACELILLKSVDCDGTDWAAAARAGIVDGYFTAALHQAPREMQIRLVNLRTWSPM